MEASRSNAKYKELCKALGLVLDELDLILVLVLPNNHASSSAREETKAARSSSKK